MAAIDLTLGKHVLAIAFEVVGWAVHGHATALPAMSGAKKHMSLEQSAVCIVLVFILAIRCADALSESHQGQPGIAASSRGRRRSLVPEPGLRIAWDAELGDATSSCGHEDLMWVDVDPLALPVGEAGFTLSLAVAGLDGSQAALDAEAALMSLGDASLTINRARGETSTDSRSHQRL